LPDDPRSLFFNPVDDDVPRPDITDLTLLARDEDIRLNRLGIYLQDQISQPERNCWWVDVSICLTSGAKTFETFNQDRQRFSPRVVVYQPSEQISLYASYSQAFNPNFATSADDNSPLNLQLAINTKLALVNSSTGDSLRRWQPMKLPRKILPPLIQMIQTLAFPSVRSGA